MAIIFLCGTCGNKMQAPESMGGQRARCPTCQTVVQVPEQILEAEETPAYPPPERDFIRDSLSRPSSAPSRPAGIPFRPAGSEFSDEGEADTGERRPCPMCGEMILRRAVKCRFCGEILDSSRHRRIGGGRNRPVAPRGSRWGAAMLDGIFYLVLLLPGLALLIASSDDKQDSTSMFGLLLLGVGGIALLVIQATMLSTKGQTIGKKIIGIRIVNFSDGSNPGFSGAVLMRSIIPGMISGIPFVGGVFSLMDILWIFGEESRCLHDLIAGTCVVDA